MRVLAQRGPSQFLLERDDGDGQVLSIEADPILLPPRSSDAILAQGGWEPFVGEESRILGLADRLQTQGQALVFEQRPEERAWFLPSEMLVAGELEEPRRRTVSLPDVNVQLAAALRYALQGQPHVYGRFIISSDLPIGRYVAYRRASMPGHLPPRIETVIVTSSYISLPNESTARMEADARATDNILQPA